MSIKHIFEVGLLNNGLPLVRRQYTDQDSYTSDPLIFGGILSALQDFFGTAFQDYPETLRMKRYLALFHRIQSKDHSKCLLYAVCESDIDQKPVQNALTMVGRKIVKEGWIEKLSQLSDTKKFTPIEKIFDDIFKPIISSDDRVKNMLSRF